MSQFRVRDTNMLVSNTLKFALPPTPTLKFALPPTPMWGAGVGHVHFMFFVLISFALGSQRKPSIQWNMGLGISTNVNYCSRGKPVQILHKLILYGIFILLHL